VKPSSVAALRAGEVVATPSALMVVAVAPVVVDCPLALVVVVPADVLFVLV
jgi:hypothetical protein